MLGSSVCRAPSICQAHILTELSPPAVGLVLIDERCRLREAE